MALRFETNSAGGVAATQTFTSPSVYLDHWAIRRLSEITSLGDRFTTALKRVGGTLVLWHLNFAEFGEAEPATISAGEELLEGVMPNVYIAIMRLDTMIDGEPSPRTRNDDRRPPPPDLELLRFIAERAVHGKAFALRGLLALAAERRDQVHGVMQQTASEIATKIAEQRQDQGYVAKARMYKPPASVPRSQVIIAELMRGAVLDSAFTFDRNDAIDLLHAVIPLSSCDFVLLDGVWEDRVRQAGQRMSKLDPPIQLAQCFSERRNGIERFLSALETWPPPQ